MATIEDFRKNLPTEILRSYMIFKSLSSDAVKLLNTKNADVKLSLDNFVKNIIHHREITLGDYSLIQSIIKKACVYV